MLTRLVLENIAIIKALDLEFQPGLNVLTGETGSGKSLILESIHRVFDKRNSPKDLLKHGETRGRIELMFDMTRIPNRDAVQQCLVDAGVDLCNEDTEIVFSRDISQSSSRSRVNGYQVPMETMEKLGRLLLEIYGQHDLHTLFSASRQRDLMDNLGGETLLELRHQVRDTFRQLQKQKARLKTLEADRITRERQVDFLTFQLNEIQQAQISHIQEDEDLKAERERLDHVQTLIHLAEQTSHLLQSEDHDSSSIFKLLGQSQKCLHQASRLDPQFTQWYEELGEVQNTLNTLIHQMDDYVDALDTRPERLHEIIDRLDILEKLKRKYGGSLETVLQNEHAFNEELARFQTHETQQETLQEDIDFLEKTLAETCQKLSEERLKTAKRLEVMVQEELADLMLPKARFEVQVQSDAVSETGQDHVNFLFSANPGEPLKPLEQVASGGELGRLMLAIKLKTAQSDALSTLVLDEIDTGMSGITVRAVTEKLHLLQSQCQLIVITHQPILAAKAAWHLHVQKELHPHGVDVNVSSLTERQHRKAVLSQLASGFTEDDLITEQFIDQLLA